MEGMNRYEVDEHKQTRDGPNVLANCTRQSYKEALISDSNTRRSDGGGDDDYLEEECEEVCRAHPVELTGPTIRTRLSIAHIKFVATICKRFSAAILLICNLTVDSKTTFRISPELDLGIYITLYTFCEHQEYYSSNGRTR